MTLLYYLAVWLLLSIATATGYSVMRGRQKRRQAYAVFIA